MVETRSGARSGERRDVAAGAVHDTAATGPAGAPLKRLAHRTGTAGGRGLNSSTAYTLLAAAHTLLTLPCIFAPKAMARLLFGSAADPPEDQHSHLLGLLCCGLLSAATVAFCLEEAARKHMLRTFTADTLKAALMAFSAGNILLQLYYPATLTPLAAMALALAMAATFALPAGQLLGREDADRVWRDFRRLPHNLYYLTTLRKFSFAGALYLLLTWMFPLAGLLYFVAPKYILYHTFGYVYGKSTQFLWKAIGGGLMSVVPAMTYTLKDKAENDLLGRSIPRSLNFGLMLASIGHLLVFGPILARGHGGFLLPLLTSSWATSLVAAMAGLATPETVTSLEGTGASISAAKDKVVGAVGEAADAAAAAVHEE